MSGRPLEVPGRCPEDPGEVPGGPWMTLGTSLYDPGDPSGATPGSIRSLDLEAPDHPVRPCPTNRSYLKTDPGHASRLYPATVK